MKVGGGQDGKEGLVSERGRKKEKERKQDIKIPYNRKQVTKGKIFRAMQRKFLSHCGHNKTVHQEGWKGNLRRGQTGR